MCVYLGVFAQHPHPYSVTCTSRDTNKHVNPTLEIDNGAVPIPPNYIHNDWPSSTTLNASRGLYESGLQGYHTCRTEGDTFFSPHLLHPSKYRARTKLTCNCMPSRERLNFLQCCLTCSQLRQYTYFRNYIPLLKHEGASPRGWRPRASVQYNYAIHSSCPCYNYITLSLPELYLHYIREVYFDVLNLLSLHSGNGRIFFYQGSSISVDVYEDIVLRFAHSDFNGNFELNWFNVYGSSTNFDTPPSAFLFEIILNEPPFEFRFEINTPFPYHAELHIIRTRFDYQGEYFINYHGRLWPNFIITVNGMYTVIATLTIIIFMCLAISLHNDIASIKSTCIYNNYFFPQILNSLSTHRS